MKKADPSLQAGTSWVKKYLILMCVGMGLFLSFLSTGYSQSGLPMDPGLFTDDTCKNCHTAEAAPKADKSNPECVECHTVQGEMVIQQVANQPKPRPSTKPVEMATIPAGTFLIGNNGRGLAEGRGNSDETPEYRAYLSTYRMDRYEVTNARYEAFVKAEGRRIPKHWKTAVSANKPDQGLTYAPEKADHPVVYVDWYDANAYCHWVGKRLPTEREWEKAARGTDGRIYPWGNRYDVQKANSPQYWLVKQQKGDTMPVGSFENGVSPYGLYDMAGNVYEWTHSWYKPYPGNHEFNAHYGYKNKIVRGGSWYDCLSYGCGLSAPSYNRSRFAPAIRNKGFGFRCAQSK